MKRSLFTLELLILALVVLSNLHVLFAPANNLLNWYTTDDAFYYYKTAQNFSEGYGLSFDRIGLSSGFHPLWMLVCIPVFALARFDLILPLRILTAISILLHAGASALLYRLLKKVISKEASFLAAMLWAFLPRIHGVTAQLGMESGINAFFLVLFLDRLTAHELEPGRPSYRSLFLTGIAAVLVLFSRLDNIYLVLLCGAWLVLRRPGPELRRLVLADLLLIPVVVFSSFFLRLGFRDSYIQYEKAAALMAVLSLVIKPIAYYIFGLYGQPKTGPFLRQFFRILAGVSAPTLLIGGAMLLLSRLKILAGFPRVVILIDFGLTLLAVLVTRLLAALLTRSKGLLPLVPGQSWLKENWNAWFRTGLAYFAPLAGMLSIYMLWSTLYFGVATPVSGQVKHWWGTLYTVYGRPVDSFSAFFGFPERLDRGPWGLAVSFVDSLAKPLAGWLGLASEQTYPAVFNVVLLLLAAICIVLILTRRKQRSIEALQRLALYPLFAGCYAQIIYYNGTNYVNTRPWYWVSEMLLAVLFLAAVIDLAYSLLQKVTRSPWPQRAVTALAGVLLLAAFIPMLLRLVPLTVHPDNVTAYKDGITALEKVTEPGSLIGSTGGGVVAYFIQGRTVVNLDGLMNSVAYFHAMQKREGWRYLDAIGLDYVYGNDYMLKESEPFTHIFPGRLEEIGLVGGTTLFRYKSTGK